MSNRFAPLLVVPLLAPLLIGCEETDLAEYGVIGDHVTVPAIEPVAPARVVEGSDTGPVKLAAAAAPVEADAVPEESSTPDERPADPTQATVIATTDPGSDVDPAREDTEESTKSVVEAGPKVLVETAEFRLEDGDLRVTFDDLDLNRVLGIERPTPDTPRHMPKWQRDLAGRRIRIRGYMYPAESQTGLTYFILVRDNMVCCFGPMAKIYDKISVKLAKGQTTDYIQNRPFDVVGTFDIAPYVIAGDLVQLYTLKDAVVLP